MPIERQAIPGLGVLTTTTVSFSTTDTAVECSAKGLKKIRILGIVPMTTIGAGEFFNVDETVDSNGLINVPSTGTFTVERVTGTTSGLTIVVNFVGY